MLASAFAPAMPILPVSLPPLPWSSTSLPTRPQALSINASSGTLTSTLAVLAMALSSHPSPTSGRIPPGICYSSRTPPMPALTFLSSFTFAQPRGSLVLSPSLLNSGIILLMEPGTGPPWLPPIPLMPGATLLAPLSMSLPCLTPTQPLPMLPPAFQLLLPASLGPAPNHLPSPFPVSWSGMVTGQIPPSQPSLRQPSN